LLAQGRPDEIRADQSVLEAYLGHQIKVGAVA
jgi:ABC-type branched-subunit amino acid transport system ATPase component